MSLSKKNRIILFVVLSFIYILFFSLYSAKALTNTMGRLNYYYYANGSVNNATGWNVPYSNSQSIELFDMNFYTTSDEVAEENYYYYISSQNQSVSSYPAKYFSFVFYTLDNIIPEFSIDNYGTDYKYSDYCNVLNTIQNDNINFYINTCTLPEVVNLSGYGVTFNENNPTLTMSSRFAFSDLYTFNNEEDLIVFITEKQALINKSTEDGELPDIVNNIYNSITSANVDSSGWGASISFWNTHNANNSVITNVITLPITLLQALLTNASDTCTSFSLGSLYNKPLSMPCIDLSRYLGNSLITIIDTIFAGFIIYNCGKKFVKIFDDLTNLRDNQINELYGGGK